MQKCLIGRPKKFKVVLQANDEIKQELDEEQAREGSHVHKCKIHQLVSTRLRGHPSWQ